MADSLEDEPCRAAPAGMLNWEIGHFSPPSAEVPANCGRPPDGARPLTVRKLFRHGSRENCSRFNIHLIVGMIADAGLTGCVGDPATLGPPHMPTMVQTKTAAPLVTFSRDDVLWMALKAAEEEDMVTMVRALEMPLRPPHARTGLMRELMSTLAGQNLLKAGRFTEALPARPMQTDAVEIFGAGTGPARS